MFLSVMSCEEVWVKLFRMEGDAFSIGFNGVVIRVSSIFAFIQFHCEPYGNAFSILYFGFPCVHVSMLWQKFVMML